jgi:hypothetical protein
MKFIQLQTGGHPFANDDLTFMQTCFQEALSGLTRMYGPHYVLSGFGKSDVSIETDFGPVPGIAFSEGWCVINNEIMYFPGQSIFASGYLTAKMSTVPNVVGDPVLYADTLAKQVYWDRRVFISASTGPINLSDFDKRRVGLNTWVSVGSGGTAPAYSVNWGNTTSPANPVKFRHFGGFVDLSGWANNGYGIGPAGPVVFILPVNCRPSVPFSTTVPTWDGSSNRSYAILVVNTDGTVTVLPPTSGAILEHNVSFDNIRIPLI